MKYFLVLVGIGCFLFFYLNNLNNQLESHITRLRSKLKDEKRHAKGLQVKIHDLTKQVSELESALKEATAESSEAKGGEAFQELEREYAAIQAQLAEMETENTQLTKSVESLTKDLNANEEAPQLDKIEESNKPDPSEPAKLESIDPGLNQNYQHMYEELKRSIGYNMEGGADFLDGLGAKLTEKGLIDENTQLDVIKQRFNSIALMVGDVTPPPSDASDEKIVQGNDQLEEQSVEQAQNSIDTATNLLDELSVEEKTVCEIGASEDETLAIIKRDLCDANLLNQRLRKELDHTTTQLKSFVTKAKLFITQKEQLKLSRVAQSQMKQDFMNQTVELKQAVLKYKNAKTRIDILNAQLKNTRSDSKKIEQLESMRSELEDKRQQMNRLLAENEMLEQQFLSMSDESTQQSDAVDELKRLKNEHQLLEAQFLEVLEEVDDEGTSKTKEIASRQIPQGDEPREAIAEEQKTEIEPS